MEQSPLQMLFASGVGLLSIFTIGFILAMAVFIFLYVRRHIREDTDAELRKDQTKE